MPPFPLSITRIDDEQLIQLIASATQRLVYVGPGLSRAVADSIAERWRALGAVAVQVILDVDPEVARLGYGTLEGLEVLQKTAAELHCTVRHQPGIRICLIVIDNSSVVFAPTPLFIEAGTTQGFHPNAIALDTVPDGALSDVGCGESGSQTQAIGRQLVKKADVDAVRADLVNNPPVKFDVARIVRVFNARFEFVEFELLGARLSRKTVSIPSDLMGLAKDEKTQRLLKSSFKLIDKSGALSDDRVNRLKAFIAKRFLIILPNYGQVVLRANKADFESAVKTLEQYMKRFQKRIRQQLQEEIEANQQTLLEALFPAVKASPPLRWRRYLGPAPSEADVHQMFRAEFERLFGSAEDVLGEMHVKVVFKGVTYELLNDPEFLEAARRAIPSLAELHEEFNAAKAG